MGDLSATDISTTDMVPLARTLNGHANHVTSLAWIHATDSRGLASGDADGKIKLWNPSSGGAATQTLEGVHTGTISALVYISTLKTLVSASHDLSIRLWECSS